MATIDYSQDSKKVLFDLINAENNIQITPGDFDLGDPEINSNIKNNKNTVIRITPKAGTGYYGSAEIYYNRMNLSDILDSQVFTYNPKTETTLLELLPQLNAFYGIYLKAEDVVNVSIPAYDPLNPSALRTVTISAQSTSYFFTDSYILTLGNTDVGSIDTDNKTRTYYLYIDGYALPEIKQSMSSLNSDGTINSDFSFLINATNISLYALDRIERQANGWFILIGSFSLIYQNANSDIISVENVKTIRVDTTGFIIDTSTDAYFNGTNCSFYETETSKFKYVIDTSIGTRPNALYRYNANTGILDSDYVAEINYVPSLVRLMDDGRIYTVSPIMTMADPFNSYNNAKQIRIDRILENGTLDTTFLPVYIKSSDSNYLPPELFDLLPEPSGTTVLYFKPVGALTNSAPVPMVNGNRIVALNTTSGIRYTWNPVIRLNANGTTDGTFSSSLNGFDEGTVMETTLIALTKGNRYLFSTDQKLTVFTERRNPITGYTHIQPLSYKRNGSMLLFAGQYYVDQYRWTSLKELKGQSNGVVLGYGMMQNDNSPASFSVLARYNSDTSIDKVLWRSPGPSGTSNPTLHKLFLDEI